MAIVEKIGEDRFKVSAFLQSEPHVSCVVKFSNGVARVVERTGTTEIIWDDHAIGTVQTAVMLETVC